MNTNLNKARPAGFTTMQENKAPIIGNEPTEKNESPADIARQIVFFTHAKHCASFRKERQEELMARPVAKRWDAPKKAKMVKRYVQADNELKESENALDQLTFRLSQLMVPAAPAATNIV